MFLETKTEYENMRLKLHARISAAKIVFIKEFDCLSLLRQNFHRIKFSVKSKFHNVVKAFRGIYMLCALAINLHLKKKCITNNGFKLYRTSSWYKFFFCQNILFYSNSLFAEIGSDPCKNTKRQNKFYGMLKYL